MKKTLTWIWQKLGSSDRTRRRNAFILFCMILATVVYGFHSGALEFKIIKSLMGPSFPIGPSQ